MNGNSSRDVAVTEESSSRGRSLPVNVLGNGSRGVCTGEERPSLFSDFGNRLPLFNPFAAVFATLGPAERCEAEFMGASEFLNRRLNEEFQRAFEAGIHSSAIYPFPAIYHIGTPSDYNIRRFSKCFISWNFLSSISSISSFVWAFDPSSVCKCNTCGMAELSRRDV